MKFQLTAMVVITTASGPVLLGAWPDSSASPSAEIAMPMIS